VGGSKVLAAATGNMKNAIVERNILK